MKKLKKLTRDLSRELERRGFEEPKENFLLERRCVIDGRVVLNLWSKPANKLIKVVLD